MKKIKTSYIAILFQNPIANDTVIELVGGILNWMMIIVTPIAVIVIIYAGVVLLTSGGKPEKLKQGRAMLTWAIIGMAIIFIGRGFIALIQSILNLAG